MKKMLDYKNWSPVMQGASILLLILIMDVLTYLMGTGPDAAFTDLAYWTNNLTGMLVYAIFNSLLSFRPGVNTVYYSHSISTYIVLCVAAGFLAYFFSGLSISEAGSLRWLVLVFSLGYLIILAIVATIKRLMGLVEKEDERVRGRQ